MIHSSMCDDGGWRTSAWSAGAAAVRAAFLVALLGAGIAHGGPGHFTRLSVEDGLSQSSVETIAEDRYGFLWIGTQEGLNRFDGYEFAVYPPSERAGHLADGFIRAIAPDPRGNLWVGTSTGLQHLDVATGRFSESVTPPAIGVHLRSVRVAPDGRIWFLARSGGLWTRPAAGAAAAQRVAIEGLDAAHAIDALALDRAGNLWVAAAESLFSLRIDEHGGAISLTATPVLRELGSARVVYADAGVLWIARDGRPLLRFDPRGGAVTEYPELPRSILAIASAGGGELWIGGRGAGLARFDPRTRRIVTYRNEPGNENSLAENDVAVVHPDRGGSLWVGAWNGGLSRLNLYSQAFRTLRTIPGEPESLPDEDVTRMVEGPDGRLWTISRNGVLSVGDPRTGSFFEIPFEGSPTAIGFAGRDLFVGTATGLREIEPATGRTIPLREEARAAGLDTARIDGLASGDDHLWIVTEGTLYRLANGDARALHRARLPSGGEPSSLAPASPERLWIAYEEGILLRAEFANGAITVRSAGDASIAARGRLAAVREDRGVIWLGTWLGLGRMRSASGPVEWIDLEQGMPSRSVAAILIDDAGVLWIPTNRGITRFDPSRNRAVHFGRAQGTQASGYVDDGAARGRSGLFYFAGRGITVFDPRQVAHNPHRPRVVFTALEVLHRPVLPEWMDAGSPLTASIHAEDEVELGPDAAVFSVTMAALGVNDPDGVRFLHRLDGFDEEWIETTADRRVATYTSLAPGRYVLRARARTRYGVWSAEDATLRIRILPPWWRTPAALILWLVLAALGTVLLVHEVRSRTRVRIALAEQEVLRRASVTDPLTGLYNRRFLTAWMKHEVPRTLRTHQPAGAEVPREFLLMVAADLDNLKEINDGFGHDAGDRALSAVAEILQSHARAEDLAVRLGGDEFVLVLRRIDPLEAAHVVERLRRSVEALEGPLDDGSHPTISLGFASFPFLAHDVDALTWEQTLQLADRALLRSKRRGRNAWSGLLASTATTASALRDHLGTMTEQELPPTLRVIEGPAARSSSVSK